MLGYTWKTLFENEQKKSCENATLQFDEKIFSEWKIRENQEVFLKPTEQIKTYLQTSRIFEFLTREILAEPIAYLSQKLLC